MYNEDEIECMVQDIVDTWYKAGLILEETDVAMVRAVLVGSQIEDELIQCLIERCKKQILMMKQILIGEDL